jgi:predicted nucleic acid-binding protein
MCEICDYLKICQEMEQEQDADHARVDALRQAVLSGESEAIRIASESLAASAALYIHNTIRRTKAEMLAIARLEREGATKH